MSRSRALLAAAALTVGAACSAAPAPRSTRAVETSSRAAPPAPPLPPPSAEPRIAARSAPIEFERLPLPLVRVTVAGFPTTMVLDTGATRTVVADWLAREASVSTRLSETLVADHTGRRMPVLEAVDPRLVMGQWGPALEGGGPGVLVAQLPDALRNLGIGGLLPPQLLGRPGEAIVVDLAERRLHAMSGAEAAQRFGARGRALAAPGAVRACGSAPDAPLFAVDATVADRPARLELNTGAADTDLKDTSSPGQALAGRATRGERTVTASGSFVSRTLGAVKLTIGEVETTSEILLVPDSGRPTCPRDGFLGMSALRACVLVLDGARSFVRCS